MERLHRQPTYPLLQAGAGTWGAAWRRVYAVFRQSLLPIMLPLFLLIALTTLFRGTDADIRVCRIFYQGGYCRWSGMNSEPCRFLYNYGPLPGLILGMGGSGLAALGWFGGRFRRVRRAGIFLTLHLALGPGLLVNGLVKPCWNRPRPKETVEFGGPVAYAPLLSTLSPSDGKSFPSGHASMGFYLIAPAFLLYRRRVGAAVGCYLLGIAWGCGVGLARIAAGGHFPSDIVWAWAIVHFSGVAIGLWYYRLPALRGGVRPVDVRADVREQDSRLRVA